MGFNWVGWYGLAGIPLAHCCPAPAPTCVLTLRCSSAVCACNSVIMICIDVVVCEEHSLSHPCSFSHSALFCEVAYYHYHCHELIVLSPLFTATQQGDTHSSLVRDAGVFDNHCRLSLTCFLRHSCFIILCFERRKTAI